MSVHDETWDRPICNYCRKSIKYGEKLLHKDGNCLKNKKCARIGCNNKVAIYAHGMGWTANYCSASCIVRFEIDNYD